MDYIVIRFGNTYGYISTGKDKEHGFAQSYQEIIDSLEKKDKDFTYATPEELVVCDDIQYINFMTRGLER